MGRDLWRKAVVCFIAFPFCADSLSNIVWIGHHISNGYEEFHYLFLYIYACIWTYVYTCIHIYVFVVWLYVSLWKNSINVMSFKHIIIRQIDNGQFFFNYYSFKSWLLCLHEMLSSLVIKIWIEIRIILTYQKWHLFLSILELPLEYGILFLFNTMNRLF